VAAIATSGNSGECGKELRGSPGDHFHPGGQKKLLLSLKVRYQRGIISGICVGDNQNKLI
jgi:hypothetical protein